MTGVCVSVCVCVCARTFSIDVHGVCVLVHFVIITSLPSQLTCSPVVAQLMGVWPINFYHS